MSTDLRTPILQFGTSRFLQAHFDLFVDEAMKDGQAVGPITVVQSTGNTARARRLDALCAPDGYTVQIRGLENGEPIDRGQRIGSVRRTLSTASDWDQIVDIAVNEAEYIVSNTGDAGFAPQPADNAAKFDQAMSYPAKLCLLLRARFAANATPITIFPMELVPDNGAVLKARILEIARNDPEDFHAWLSGQVIWANSLVDRIVSEPIDPAGAVAEPYALWAIERQPGLVAPCTHPCIKMVDDLGEIEALKLFILNLGHTWLANRWIDIAKGQPVSVVEFLSDPATRKALMEIYKTEVLPGFAKAGLEDAARAYLATTMDRFDNPFLDHQIGDIAQNHAQKVERRLQGFIEWARRHGDMSEKPGLTRIITEVSRHEP